ncbi:hypothetical protein C8F04DRAFT_1198698 [Mycena alexandri]|uniref:Uncharacterized protein n=1 Tax=Mycena alexandri TaxID=1745969 RepID=A0AAD6S0A3_9AGAR|nr:hypothetical protein C8F04DRAFT_1198698 [Mycena alexandri]
MSSPTIQPAATTATPEGTEPDSQYAAYLKNSNPAATLGPLDGVVAALVTVGSRTFLITTHTDYVPALPPVHDHDVFLREDMRYGVDDVTLWPQRYSARYCHLGAMQRPDSATPESAVMFWSPRPSDFKRSDDAPGLALGKLSAAALAALEGLVRLLLGDYEDYKAASQPSLEYLPPLVHEMERGLQRLQTTPSTYEQAVLGTRDLQHTCLEVDALIEYMTVCKPRMKPGIVPCRPAALMGVFTGDPQVAETLSVAGIPLREASSFSTENILKIVAPRSYSHLDIPAHPKYSAICRTGADTDEKIEAMRKVSRCIDWYCDPFESMYQEAATTSGSAGSSRGGRGRGSGGGRDGNNAAISRYAPCKRPLTPAFLIQRENPHKAHSPKKASEAHDAAGGRNKFLPIPHRPEMPESITAWETALGNVDIAVKLQQRARTDTYYVFPEPALLASPESENMRQIRLHHFLLLKDALEYRIVEQSPRLLLSSQEWRDTLAGKVTQQGRQNSKGRARSGVIEELLAPALKACDVDRYSAFPVDLRTVAPITRNRAREIIWEVAEVNFRYELVSLDHRATGLCRRDECSRCFAGGMLVGMPIETSKEGLAAAKLEDRHVYNVELAKLMCGWRGEVPDVIKRAAVKTGAVMAGKMRELEEAVATLYCQRFYEYFRRAAVIPMRIQHEFGS